jgi:hypothetical protein
MVANWSAKAVDDSSLDAVRVMLTRPLAATDSTGQPNTLPLVDRRDLFWSPAMLEYSDKTVLYIREQSWNTNGVRKMFASEQDYLNGLSVFLFTTALMYQARHPDAAWPLYPGFKLISGSSPAIQHFVSRISADRKSLETLAAMAGEDAGRFKEKWPERINVLNAASLGGRHDIMLHWSPIQQQI